MRRSAFTLVELLVVIAVIAVLAALLLPAFLGARERSRSSNCAANLRQLGAAIQMYEDDYDSAFPLNYWGGGTYGYVKSVAIYRCPEDGTPAALYHGRTMLPNSYAMNFNLFHTRRSVDVAAPAQTVQLFEAFGCRAMLTDPQEGVISDSVHPPQISCMGAGTDSGLVSIGPAKGDPEPPLPGYATGVFDNYHNSEPLEPSPFAGSPGRHHDGSNLLAVDGHVKWLKGTQVSAGESAFSAPDDQKPTGCPYPGIHDPQNSEPCAAGTGNGRHTLTFSLR